MKPTPKAAALLEQMGRIDRMERGKICQMKGREHFNHQTWQKGRNVVRYVPREEVGNLQAAIDGYARFMQLAQHYADEIIRLTRQDQSRNRPQNNGKTANSRKNAPQKRPD